MIDWWDIKKFEQLHNSIFFSPPPPLPVWYHSQYFSQFSSLLPPHRRARAVLRVLWTSLSVSLSPLPPDNVHIVRLVSILSVVALVAAIRQRAFARLLKRSLPHASRGQSTTRSVRWTLIAKSVQTMCSSPGKFPNRSFVSTNCASPALLLCGHSITLAVPIAPWFVQAMMQCSRTHTVAMLWVVRCPSSLSSALPAETLSSSIQCWISITNIQAVTGRTGLQQPQPPPLPHWPRETLAKPPPDPRSSPRDPHRPPPARWVRATSLSIGNLCGRWPLRSSLEPFWTWSHPTQTIKLNLFYLDPVYLVSCPTARK